MRHGHIEVIGFPLCEVSLWVNCPVARQAVRTYTTLKWKMYSLPHAHPPPSRELASRRAATTQAPKSDRTPPHPQHFSGDIMKCAATFIFLTHFLLTQCHTAKKKREAILSNLSQKNKRHLKRCWIAALERKWKKKKWKLLHSLYPSIYFLYRLFSLELKWVRWLG